MRRLACCLLSAALACAPARAGEEQDRYEEQATTRCAHQVVERTMRGELGERGQWVRELEGAYPGKLDPKAKDEAAAWFALVAGTGDAWKKSDAAAAGLSQMYERLAQRLELGPVPSIKRDEFLRFARQITQNAAPGPEPNFNDSADKAFRVLDANGDGELTGDELSSLLREEKGRADANGNGRISKEEYRGYFKQRVEKKAETLSAAYKANGALWRGLEGRGRRGGLPEWFTKLDTDKDKQVSLFEWRKGGRPALEFQKMDLDGDGLLTQEEYRRYLKLKELEGEEKKEEEEE
jgi:Ca2+-binding EF-hand superfamily protein